MTLNPRDYDRRELRHLADRAEERAFGRSEERDATSAADEAARGDHHRELLLLEATGSTEGAPEKPYLTSLPKTYAGEATVFEWLDVLINKSGFKATGEALSYYETIDWLDADVREELRTYMRGFSEVRSFDPDEPGPFELDVDDHVLSLVYIARLAAMD